MRSAKPILCLLALSAGTLAGVPGVRAGSNLLDNSPFLPPNALSGASQEAAPLELRSILRVGGQYQFSLYDTARRQSTWVGVNETGQDFVVKAFDSAKDTVTVEQRGQTFKLALKEAKIALLPAMAAPAAPGGPGGPPVPGVPFPQAGAGPAGVRGPVPALTPEQLRNLEADINRRRELRRRAMANPAGTGTGPAPASGQRP